MHEVQAETVHKQFSESDCGAATSDVGGEDKSIKTN